MSKKLREMDNFQFVVSTISAGRLREKISTLFLGMYAFFIFDVTALTIGKTSLMGEIIHEEENKRAST